MITTTPWGYIEDMGTGRAQRLFVREGSRTPTSKHDFPYYLVTGPDSVVWVETGEGPDEMEGIWAADNQSINLTGCCSRITAIKDSFVYVHYDHGAPVSDEERKQHEKTPGGRLSDEEFKELLSGFVRWTIGTNVMDVDEARAVSDAIRDRRRIGFCNGCFDLIHLGHAELFLQAKQCCDTLFVAVNSDESIRKLKGDARPFVDEAGRTGMVASMRFVDHVVRNPGLNCVDAVRAVRPHVYVTTSEHGKEGPEAIAVVSQGGDVVVVDKLPGYSTTKIANSVADSLP